MVRFVTFGGLNPPPYHLDPPPYHQVLRGGDPLPWFLCCGLGFDRRRTRCHSWWRRCLLGLRWIKVDILKQFSVLTSKCLVAVRKRSLEDFAKPTVKSGLWAISSESSLTPTTRPSVSRNHFSGKRAGGLLRSSLRVWEIQREGGNHIRATQSAGATIARFANLRRV